MGLVLLSVVLWRRRSSRLTLAFGSAVPYDDQFDRKSVNSVLDWYVLRHLEDQTRLPTEQRFLKTDFERNDFLNRYYRHLLAREGVDVPLMGSTRQLGRRQPGQTYQPAYFPDETYDEDLVTFKHVRIAGRLVKTVGYLSRLQSKAAEPLYGIETLKEGYWPFVPEGYSAFYNNLIATGQDFDQDPEVREQMRRLVAHLLFPRFAEHVAFWADKGLTVYQIPEVIARDALEGWFYLDVPPRPMPTMVLSDNGDD